MKVVFGLAGLVSVLVLGLASVPSASGEVDGDCQIFVQDQDLAQSERPRVSAVDGNLTYRIISTTPIARWTVTLHYGPFERVVFDEQVPPGTLEREGSMSIGGYTQYGTGVYEVRGAAEMRDGSTCTATMLLDVQGGLFSSALGLAAVAIVGASAIGLILTIAQIILDAKDVVDAAKDFRHAAKVVAALPKTKP